MNKIVICLLFILASAAEANPWHGSVYGKISVIEVTSGNNYGFRVVLEGTPKLCGNNHAWAYLNESDSNYQVFVSVLTAAKAAGQSVILYTTRQDNSAEGYCHIGYIRVN